MQPPGLAHSALVAILGLFARIGATCKTAEDTAYTIVDRLNTRTFLSPLKTLQFIIDLFVPFRTSIAIVFIHQYDDFIHHIPIGDISIIAENGFFFRNKHFHLQ